MKIVSRNGRTAERNAEEHFIRRIGQRVRRFREQRCGSRNQSADQLRNGDDKIHRQCNEDRTCAVTAPDSLERRARTPMWWPEHLWPLCSLWGPFCSAI